MEDKEFYTQTEISTALGKSLSNLAFYKSELRELGYMIINNNKEVITKEGFNYLKLRFAGQLEKKQQFNLKKANNEKTEPKIQISEIADKSAKNKKDDKKVFTEKDLEIEQLKIANSVLQEKNNDLNSQILKWENECKAWQKNVEQTNEDKQFWQDFATKELGTLKNKLLPETTENLTPTPPKKSIFSIFRKNRETEEK